MTSDFQKGIISLIRSSIKSEPAVLPNHFDWSEALKVADRHQITPMIYYGAHKSGIELPDDSYVKLKRATYYAATVDTCQNCESSELFRTFSKNDIDYMPLKGILLKQFYPNPELRVMSDVDVLIKVEQYEAISDIMKRLGYFEKVESDHELVWSKPPIMIIELHKRLIPSYNKDYYAYFGDGWQFARRSEYDPCRHEMCDEDQLIYLFTHFAKHYRDGGVGIKQLVDLWVFLNKNPEMNADYIRTELTELQLYQFYLNILDTIDVWFCNAAPNEMSDFITKRVFDSGAYGEQDERTIASTVKALKSAGSATKARRKKVLAIIFLPYPSMCKKYPVLKIVSVLLPLFWLVRIIQTVLFKPESILRQRADMDIMTVDNINRYHDDLNYVGLDFNFKE